MRVVVTGPGRVGLPLAVRAAEVGHRVVGYDPDGHRVERLTAGGSHVEDVPAARLRPLLASGAYRPSADPADVEGFDVAVITVPAPLRDGAPDLSRVEAAAVLLARHLRPGATVVLETTAYPGTTEELLAPLLEEGSGLTAGRDFHLGCSPERTGPGDPARRLENTPKVVSGVGPAALAAVDGFYRQLVERTVPVSSCRQAELTRLLECGFRQVNTALVNELAMFAHDLGLDLREAIDAAATEPFGPEPFGPPRLTPGPGADGPCLPIDPAYLPWRAERALGQSFRLVELANEVNGRMPDYVVRRLAAALEERRRPVRGARVLLLGPADACGAGDCGRCGDFADLGDSWATPAIRIAELLVRAGAEVRVAGPRPGCCPDGRPAAVTAVRATPRELAGADAVVLLSDHADHDDRAVARHARYVLDCRRRPAGAAVEVL
ncbi:nucleotide sugar dehydrogenase [Kitasatospora indigofera]|uniref:nucleotide sugar dehydrogenase n=1 Tax=Kitasatospora indigofera TaxID=67307 RepID=UPI001E5DEE82|nr:nucleotide sugar dehydrogenase [Kitasatospora indigofera]